MHCIKVLFDLFLLGLLGRCLLLTRLFRQEGMRPYTLRIFLLQFFPMEQKDIGDGIEDASRERQRLDATKALYKDNVGALIGQYTEGAIEKCH